MAKVFSKQYINLSHGTDNLLHDCELVEIKYVTHILLIIIALMQLSVELCIAQTWMRIQKKKYVICEILLNHLKMFHILFHNLWSSVLGNHMFKHLKHIQIFETYSNIKNIVKYLKYIQVFKHIQIFKRWSNIWNTFKYLNLFKYLKHIQVFETYSSIWNISKYLKHIQIFRIYSNI